MNEIYYSERNKLLFKNAPTLERFCAKLLGDCKEFDPEIFFLHYFTIFTRSVLEDIWPPMYTFSDICRNLTALGVRNALKSVESSIQVDFFTCRPAKYTALPVEHTRTLKQRFLCLIFGARISDLFSKYGKASSITSEFGDGRTRVRAVSAINNFCVLVLLHQL